MEIMSADDTSCVFCRIIRQELPCSKIYEDEKVLAFLDLAPIQSGHTLLVPKAHAATLLDLEPGYGESLLRAMRLIGRAMRDELRADGFNCLQNNFPAAGQVVMHLHWHIIPRFVQDKLAFTWIPRKYTGQDEMADMARRLSARAK
jgi:histidine triad (HIT) family protein